MTLAYRYRAARSDGSIETGSLAVATRAGAVEHLNDRGLFPIAIEADESTRLSRGRLSTAELAFGLRTLATLLESGLPINRALTTFAEIAPSGWARGMNLLIDRVRQGEGLAGALEQCGLGVPDVTIGI